MDFGTLADGQGSLPFADGPFHPPTDSWVLTLTVFGDYLGLVDW